jgi:hypothetical protein
MPNDDLSDEEQNLEDGQSSEQLPTDLHISRNSTEP